MSGNQNSQVHMNSSSIENQFEKSEKLRLPPELCSLHVTEPIEANITIIQKPKKDGPIGRITRNQDVDLVGSKFIYSCLCGSRNGVDVVCKRISCQGSNVGCKMTSPRCWPKFKPLISDCREVKCPIRVCFVSTKSLSQK